MLHREAFAGKMVTAAKGKGYLGGKPGRAGKAQPGGAHQEALDVLEKGHKEIRGCS